MSARTGSSGGASGTAGGVAATSARAAGGVVGVIDGPAVRTPDPHAAPKSSRAESGAKSGRCRGKHRTIGRSASGPARGRPHRKSPPVTGAPVVTRPGGYRALEPIRAGRRLLAAPTTGAHGAEGCWVPPPLRLSHPNICRNDRSTISSTGSAVKGRLAPPGHAGEDLVLLAEVPGRRGHNRPLGHDQLAARLNRRAHVLFADEVQR